MRRYCIALILLWAGAVVAQQSLPSYDTIDRIKNLARVYVASDNEDSRKRIIKALSKDKTLEVVNSPDDAQFFLQYSELSREVAVSGERTKERQQRSQMIAFVIGPDKRKVIVWSENRSRDTENFMGMKMYDSGRNESELVKKFLKALKSTGIQFCCPSAPVRWQFFQVPLGGNGSNPDINADGTVRFSGFQNTVIAQESFPGDFSLWFSADPSNSNLPNNTTLQLKGSEVTATQPVFSVIRPVGTTNADVVVSDGNGAFHLSMTYPNKITIQRVGTELTVSQNGILRYTYPNFLGELSLFTAMQANETAVLYKPRFSLSGF